MRASTVAIMVLMVLGLAYAAEASDRGKENKVTSAPVLAREYKSTTYNFSMRYPEDWEIVFTDEHEAPWVKPVGLGGPRGAGGRPGFTLSISAISSPATIESYMKKAQSDLQKIFGAIDVIRTEKREVNGYPAAWMEYTYRGGAMRELNVTLVMGTDRHVLMQFICECPASRYDQYTAVFADMMKSVRLTSDRLALPHVIFTGVQKCGACGNEFGLGEAKHAFFDAERQDFLAVCEKCKATGSTQRQSPSEPNAGSTERTSKTEDPSHDKAAPAKSTDAWQQMVDAFLAKDFPHAVDLGKNRTREQPRDAVAHFLLGCAYSRLGRQMECLRHHQIAYKQLDGQRAILELTADLATRRPNSAQAIVLWGTALDFAGQETEAVRAYEKAIATDPKDEEAYLNLANVYKARKEFGKAESAYQSVLAHVPDCVGGYSALGLLYDENLKQTEQAEGAYKKALAIDPSAVNALYNYGNLLMRKNDNPGAEALYRRLIEKQPDFAPAYVNLGGLRYYAGDTSEALKYFRKAEELDPDGQYGKAAKANIRALTE